MIIIISYSYLITTTYYLSKHPKCKKKSHLIYSSVAVQRKRNIFSDSLFLLPLLDPRYLRFTVQIPVFRGGFFPKKKQKIQVCSFVVFVKSSLLQQQQKNICH